MKRRVLMFFALFAIIFSVEASAVGIEFFKGTYAEALAKAKREKKQVFIDFYTEWCGPCLNMAENVFILPDVGEVYNSNFICLKIDAEKGEGIELGKKFKIYSFPTYVFINPKTGEMSHRSGGNKSAEDFIDDTKGALNSKLSCFYLDAEYKKGGYEKAFLMSYINLKRVSGDRDGATKLFNELISMGATLSEKATWDLYVKCINGYDNPYLIEVSKNYDKYVALYGKKEVDAKLESATSYAPKDTFANLCEFEGKEYNMKMNDFNACTRSKKYDEAADIMSYLLSEGKFDREKVINQLSFVARISPNYNADETPYEWILKQVEYLRYIAYNKYNRNEARAHFDYATGLEYLIKRSIKEGKVVPSHLLEAPILGKKEYDMRPANLKTKPKRK